ncbi:glycosyltransferase family 4 protein [Mycobacterium sp. WMMD1722]|uniref:glycosyltransferase family 4 protein n=1 Tax=Mycobacterium sp. WMMD1722 TaxID=3404117 RepID=UPI003BF4A98D
MNPEAADRPKRVVILVENLPVPFDRRVWQEATTLRDHGWEVTVICPTGKGYEELRDVVAGIHVYRFRLPTEGDGALSYLAEYSTALWHTFRLALKVRRERGFDVIHACNPPDFFFLVGLFFKLFSRTRFLFDHHDIMPELYVAKFGRRGLLWKVMVWLERATFRTADVSIATNESYRRIAIERGGMDPQRVFVVRSGPMLERLKMVPPKPELKCGKRYLVGYVGVMGKQEGIDLLLLAVKHIVEVMDRHDIHVGLVGGGTSLEEMRQLALSEGIAEYVTFTGRVPDDELLDMLNTADICVNPDVANEMNDKSTMNKIMEYMALGKAIVQFDLTEGRYSAGEASLYAAKNDPVDLARKIVELLDDPDRRTRMGEFGQRRVQNELAWNYEVPNLIRAYDAVMSSTNGIRTGRGHWLRRVKNRRR